MNRPVYLINNFAVSFRLHLLFQVAVTFFVISSSVQGQKPPEYWGNVRPGEYPIGFKTLFYSDYSRVYRTRKSLETPDEFVYRPIRIHLWYPTTTDKDSHPFLYSNYLKNGAESKEIKDWNQQKLDRDARMMQNTYGTGKVIFDRLLGLPTNSFEAPFPKDAHFPLILYSLGTNSYGLENTILWEMLASHGYAVAVIPQFNGQWPALSIRGVTDRESQEHQIRDLEFSISKLIDLEFVDRSKIGLMGFSGGGLYAFLAGMKNPDVIDAFASLDGSIAYKHVKGITDYHYFDPLSVKFPILNLHKSSDNLDLEILNSLENSDRFHVGLGKAYHLDFTQLPMINNLDPESQTYYRDEALAHAVELHESINTIVLHFFDSYLKQRTRPIESISAFMDSLAPSLKLVDVKYTVRESKNILTEIDIVRIINEQGLDEATSALRQHNQTNRRLDVKEFDWWANVDHVYHGKHAEAIAILEFVRNYDPSYIKAYLDLGNLYARSGDVGNAKNIYSKGLAVISKSEKTAHSLGFEKRIKNKLSELK